jgi:hypothetical protein
VFDTCRMFGASLATSHKVAGVFAENTAEEADRDH